MFQLQPVGSVANIQVCGTTTCMVCGAEDLIAVCKEKIAEKPHQLSADGKLSWEEVECLGACSNAPMAQIGKDFYEDLTTERLGQIIDELASGQVPTPGPQNGRYASEALGGATNLKDHEKGRVAQNASVALATSIGDTVHRIDGSEVPLTAPWLGQGGKKAAPKKPKAAAKPKATPRTKAAAPAMAEKSAAKPKAATKPAVKPAAKAKAAKPAPIKVSKKPIVAAKGPGKKPRTMKAPRKAGADDLKLVKGIGPAMEDMLHELGFFHFDQLAKWGPQEVAWVDQNLKGFKGRVSRDNWVVQAQRLALGELTEFAARAQKKGK
jgi:NADH-quinone oxidoreductase subunit E